jgi:Bacterial archaeo-eukaryotic release factor family 3
MDLIKSKSGFEAISSVGYQPVVSVIMPFSPVTMLKQDLESRINFITGKVESLLIKNYTAELAMPIIFKLKSVFRNLNYYTHQKSVAIFVSPMIEKIIYLGLEMDEQVSIDPAFKITNMVNARKDQKEYLVLLLCERFSKMYHGKANELKLIKSNTLIDSKQASGDLQNISASVFPGVHTGVTLDKFLKQMDVGLSIILKSYTLPVFVLGTQQMVDRFKLQTRNGAYIVEYDEGNYDLTSGCDLIFAIKNSIERWGWVKNRFLLNQVENARENHKLAAGLQDALSAAMKNNGRLLVLEKNYADLVNLGKIYESGVRKTGNFNALFFIKDEVDELVEKVFESGGDVAFVDDGLLKSYGKIALVEAG